MALPASPDCKQLEAAGVLELADDVKRNRVCYSPDALAAYMDIDALR